MKTRLRISVIAILVFAAMMFAAVLLAELTELPVYDDPFTISGLALLAFLTVICCFSKRWLTLKNCGFLICHLGLVLFLASAFVWYVWGSMGVMSLYAGGQSSRVAYEESDDGAVRTMEMPFAVECSGFEISYHPYRYTYAVLGGSGYEEKGTAELTESGFDCGRYGNVPAECAYGEDGSLKTQIQYENLLLTWDGEYPAVKQYAAEIAFSDGGVETVSVNNPAVHNGWKIYLMSYSAEMTDSGMATAVNFQVKRDPAVGFATAGLILCPIGTFLLCFRPRGRKEGGADGE